MSNYMEGAWNPEVDEIQPAMWIDDFFGKHRYGVCFDINDSKAKVYTPEEVSIPIDRIFVRAARKPKRLSIGGR